MPIPPSDPLIQSQARYVDPEEVKSVRPVSQSYLVLYSSLVQLAGRLFRVDVQYLHDYGLEINTGRIKGSLWPSSGKIDQKSKRDFFFCTCLQTGCARNSSYSSNRKHVNC